MISAPWRHWIQKQSSQCGFLYIFPRTPSLCEGCWPQLEAIAPTVGNHESELKVSVAQSCLTLCNRMDCGLPGSSVHGILQSRILEWVAILSPGIFPTQGSNLHLPALQADSFLSEPPGKPALLRYKWINDPSCCSSSNHPRKSSWGLNPEFTNIISCCHQGC